MSKRIAKAGNVVFGDGNIKVQTMLQGDFHNYSIDDLLRYKALGCEILRFSILRGNTQGLKEFIKSSPMPICIDIQGGIDLVKLSIKSKTHKIRINPGNFNLLDIDETIRMAKDNNVCIRIGLNKGSAKGKSQIELAQTYLNLFEKKNFYNTVVSLKSSSIQETIDINREFYSLGLGYPIHLGLTEAGPIATSAVRSTLALYPLLKEGIGDTIRISVSGSEEDEIEAATELLRALKLRKCGLNIISCPMCARASFDTQKIVKKLRLKMQNAANKNLTIAVMGCPVNGIGEAKDADYTISGANGKVLIFKKNAELVKQLIQSDSDKIIDALIRVIT